MMMRTKIAVDSRKKRLFKKQDIPLYFMALPAALMLLLFDYMPMTGVVLAFKKFSVAKGIFGSDWCGLDNFKFLFASTSTPIILRNTVLYNVVFIIVNTCLSITLALILNELISKFCSKVFQTVFMLPHFLSWAAVAILVSAFLEYENGFVNSILVSIGAEKAVDWYQQITLWPPLLVFLSAWKIVGYDTVIYLAVISSVPPEHYEAAVLDGATRFQQAIYVTLPHLRTIIAINLILSIGGIFYGDFGLFYTVTKDSGALFPVTNIIDTYVYRSLMGGGNIGMSSAVGFLQSFVGCLLVVLANKVVTKIEPESALF